MAALTASCSGVPVFTGATGGGSVGAGNQPMPPALVGNGAPSYDAAPSTPPPVQTAALPPAGGPSPIASQPVPAAAAPAATAATPSVITVQSGDTLYSLARQYNVSVRDLAAANGLSITDGLRIGQQVVLPGSGIAAAAPAGGGQQLGAPPRDLGVVPADPAATTPAAAATPATPAAPA
ncbi:MAG: LysM peptidoglycan-binding domain-containing protein, partial [Bauldia sp.]|nr:LysM peptidoglycan-binding domain-containing protein [Bauldia sp.]